MGKKQKLAMKKTMTRRPSNGPKKIAGKTNVTVAKKPSYKLKK